MQINPADGSCQDQDESSSRCGLPSERETESKREPAPALRTVSLGGSFCCERPLDTGPQERRIGVVAQFLRRDAYSLPSAEFFGAGGTVRAVRFESSPFRRRAILKNPVAVFTCNVHRLLPCSGGSVAPRRLKHLAKISLRLKKCVL